MKRDRKHNDPLERLFAAARRERVPDDGFTQRVLERIEPVPPSRNLYRVPTFATAFASALLIVWMSLSGFDPSGLVGRRQADHGLSERGMRLTPVAWKIPHVPENKETQQSKP